MALTKLIVYAEGDIADGPFRLFMTYDPTTGIYELMVMRQSAVIAEAYVMDILHTLARTCLDLETQLMSDDVVNIELHPTPNHVDAAVWYCCYSDFGNSLRQLVNDFLATSGSPQLDPENLDLLASKLDPEYAVIC